MITWRYRTNVVSFETLYCIAHRFVCCCVPGCIKLNYKTGSAPRLLCNRSTAADPERGRRRREDRKHLVGKRVGSPTVTLLYWSVKASGLPGHPLLWPPDAGLNKTGRPTRPFCWRGAAQSCSRAVREIEGKLRIAAFFCILSFFPLSDPVVKSLFQQCFAGTLPMA